MAQYLDREGGDGKRVPESPQTAPRIKELRITSVANGYIVAFNYDVTRDLGGEQFVFESLTALKDFLEARLVVHKQRISPAREFFIKETGRVPD